MSVKKIIILILFALVLIFVIQNVEIVEVRLLVWKVSISRSLMLLGTLIIGLIAGWVLKGAKSKKPKA